MKKASICFFVCLMLLGLMSLALGEGETLQDLSIRFQQTPETGRDLTVLVEDETDTAFVCEVRFYKPGSSTEGGADGYKGVDVREKSCVIPGWYLTEAGTYVVQVSTMHGQDQTGEEAFLSFVLDAPSFEGPEVTVSPSTVPMESFARITLHMDGADLFHSDGSEEIEADGTGSAADTEYVEPGDVEDGQMVYRAFARVGGVWSRAATVRVPVLDNGVYTTPVLDAQESYPIGEDFTIHFTGCDEDAVFHCWLYDDQTGENMRIVTQREEAYVTITGHTIREKGRYRLEVMASRAGWRDSEKAVCTFTVDGTQAEGPEIRMDTDTPCLESLVVFTAVKPGATHFDFDLIESFSSSSGTVQPADPATSSSEYSTWIHESSEHTMYVRALVDGAWTAWSRLSFTPVDMGQLDPPVLQHPDKLQLGENLPVTIPDFPEGASCFVRIFAGDETETWRGVSLSSGVSEIRESYFDRAGTYRLEAAMNMEGRADSEVSVTYVTAEGERKPGPEVSLSDTRFPVNSIVEVPVYLDEAESFEGFIQSLDLKSEFWFYAESWAVEDGRASASGRIYTPVLDDSSQPYEISARMQVRAVVDGTVTDWTTLPVTVYSLGTLPAPEVTAEGGRLGQDVSVSFSGCDTAQTYSVCLLWTDEAGVQMNRGWDTQDNSFVIEEDCFDHAGTYEIQALAHASGYESEKWGMTEITMQGERPAGPEITCEAEKLFTDREYSFTLTRTGATRFLFAHDGYEETLDAENGTATVSGYTGMEAGTGTFQAKALVDGVWSAYTKVDYEIEDPRPVFHIPENLPIGQNLNGWIEADGYTSGIRYAIYHAGSNQLLVGGYYRPGSGEVTLADEEWFQEPGDYVIGVRLSWAQEETRQTFTVTGMRPEPPALTILDENVVLGDMMHVLFEMEGADAFEYEFSGYYRTVPADEQGKFTGELPVDREVYYTDCMFSLRARVQGVWSKWLEQTVTVKESDILPAPDLTVAEKVSGDEDLTFVIGEIEEATDYVVTLFRHTVYDEQTGAWYPEGVWSEVFEEAGEKTCPREYLADPMNGNGDWTLSVYGFSNRYRDFEVRDVDFTVTGGSTQAEEIRIQMSNDRPGAGSTVNVTLSYPGAQRFEVEYLDAPQTVAASDGEAVCTLTAWPESYTITVKAFGSDGWLATGYADLFMGSSNWISPVKVDVPMVFHTGDRVTLTIPETEGAVAYSVYVRRLLLDGLGVPVEHKVFTQAGQVSLDTVLTKEGRYELTIYPRIPDVNVDCCAVNFAVVAGAAEPAFGEADFLLPAALAEIEEEAFAGIRAERVRIPEGVKTIGDRAFAASSLTAVYMPGSVVSIGEDVLPEGTVVYTPAGSPAALWAQENGFEVVTE